MRTRYAILGGGCAGLSLACALADRDLDAGGVVIVEARPHYERDRTWCHWAVEAHPFEDAIAHRWARWEVRDGDRRVVHASPDRPYCLIPADGFYDVALARLAGRAGVERWQPCRVFGVRSGSAGVTVETDRGSLAADVVFDSRPAATSPVLWQHFLGREIEVDADVFDPATATLMDFGEPSRDGVNFFYVLPVTRRRALVEATWFGPRPLAPAFYRERIDRHVASRFGVERYRTRFEERGRLPMDTSAPPPAPAGVVRIGAAAGLIRPSTGFAFLNIQRWTAAMADRLARGRQDPPSVLTRPLRAMDRVFLDVLRREPERGPAMFMDLFSRVPARTLTDFLSDRVGVATALSVIRAMPRRPFARAGLRVVMGAPR